MAEETVQIKQEPLDDIYAAEIADINDVAAAAAITTSSGSGSRFSYKDTGNGRGACNLLNKIGVTSTMAVGFSNNVTIKIEPDNNAYDEEMGSGEYAGGFGGITAQELLEAHRNGMMSEVQVKPEPLDFDSPNLPNSSNAQEHAFGHDFKVVDEHDKFITISAADLSPDNEVLQLKQKLQAIKELGLPINLPKTSVKKTYKCTLCVKRYYQVEQYAHHMDQHRRNRMFCARKTCDSWFSSLEDCERHEFEAHDILQLKCNVCNHKFLSFEQLSIHKVKMHSKLNRFVCSLCRDWFISIAELQEHWSFLPDLCGRLANIDALEQPYKRKCAPTVEAGGLKLRLQAAPQPSKPAHLVIQGQTNDIEIKQEPIDLETLLSHASIPKKMNTIPAEKCLAVATNTNNLTAAPQLKLRLRKQPLSPTRSKPVNDDRSTSSPAMQNNSNALGLLLARRITSKFSLKTVPKMFNLTNKVSEIKEQQQKVPLQPQQQQQEPQQKVPLQPQQQQQEPQQKVPLQPQQEPQHKVPLQPQQQQQQGPQQEPQLNAPSIGAQSQLFTKWQGIGHNKNKIITVPNEPPFKMLKLAANLKIVPLQQQVKPAAATTTFRTLTKIVPQTVQYINITNPTAEQPTVPMFQKFILQKVEIPSLDKQLAVAKLEDVTKANKELTLTELLDETIVHEKSNASSENIQNTNSLTNKPLDTVEQMLIQQQQSGNEKRAEEIKTEFIENMMAAIQNDDSLNAAANFSDNSLGSNSTSLPHSANSENDNGNVPHQRSRSLPAKEKVKDKDAPNFPSGDYVCPRCGRRYSSATTVQEHLRNNCGRNLRYECEVCHKCFYSMSTLNCHRTVHTGDLPHKCNYCDKRFRTRGQVTVHHRTHTGERPFVCEICSQSFTHRETLISHLSRHIGMKRYKCYGCNKQFSCISGLSMHRATRPDTCAKFELNTRAIGPRVRVIRGRVVFDPQPAEPGTNEDMIEGSMNSSNSMSADKALHHTTEVLAEIQNK